MRLSLRGMTKNTINDLKALKEEIESVKAEIQNNQTDDVKDYFEDEHIEGLILNIEAYHDIIVAILQGKATIEEAKEFLFSDGSLDDTKLFGNLIRL